MLRRLAPLLFVLSGLAGLVLQVAWFRLLSQSLGGTLAAATAVLTAFMAGLALGAAWFSRKPGLRRSPLLAYGLLEIGAGAFALLTLPLLVGLDRFYGVLAMAVGERPGVLLAVKLVLAAVCLMPATTFMGGTLPALCQALAEKRATAGGGMGGLYALNVGGAVVGTLLALFWLLPSVGLSGSVAFAGVLDLAIGGAVFLAFRRDARAALVRPEAPPVPPSNEDAPDTEAPSAVLRVLPGLLFAIGLAGIAYEVLWTRILAFYFGSGAQAFGLVLAVVLLGLSLGGFLGGHVADRTRRPLAVLAATQVLVAVFVVVQVWRFPHLPDFLYELALSMPRPIRHGRYMTLLLFGAIQLILPVAICMGAAFPAAVRAAMRSDGNAGPLVGRLASANALGTIPGAVLAAWLFVPLLGVQGALFFTAGISLSIALLVLTLGRPSGQRARVLVPGLAVLAGLALLATRVDPQRALGGSGVFADDGGSRTLLLLDESAHGTVSLSTVKDSRGSWVSFSVDAVNVAGTAPPLLACQTLQGQLPLLLHGAPQRILHVGFGSGGTAAAVASHAGVERIDVAEINPAILRVAREHMRRVNLDVLDDPRVKVHLADGRNYLLGTSDRFDCILSDSVHPRYRGNANLYTVDYFRLCREHLAPGGLVSTWLPIYSLSQDSLRSIIKSMREVFPATSVWYLNSTVNEFAIIVGRMDEGPFDAARIGRAMRQPAVAESLARVGVTSPAHLLDYYIGEGRELDRLVGDVPLHFDDLPWVEFESAAVLDRNGSWRVNFALLVAARTSILPHLGDVDPGFRDQMAVFESATSEALEGQLDFLARRYDEAREHFRAAVLLNPADREPWEHFGSPPWVHALVAGEGQASAKPADPADEAPARP